MTNMTSNLNQDGVDQCKARMREAISQNDTPTATKFMEKAVRLGADPSDMRDLLSQYATRATAATARRQASRRRSASRKRRAAAAAASNAATANGNGNTGTGGTVPRAAGGAATQTGGGSAPPSNSNAPRSSASSSASNASSASSASSRTQNPASGGAPTSGGPHTAQRNGTGTYTYRHNAGGAGGNTATSAGSQARAQAGGARAGGGPGATSSSTNYRPAPGAGGGGGTASASSSSSARASGASRPSTGSSSSPGTAAPKRDYTADQMQLVQRILRTKDFYAIMGLTKTASVDEIKKAYKKLALKLHPDKNGAPGAEEAFKKLSKAMQCLEDENKRRIYDQCGDPDRAEQQSSGGGGGFRQDDFMSANDFFDMFFNGGAVHRRQAGGARGRQQQQQQAAPEDIQRQQILNLLPLLFLLLTALTSTNIFQPQTRRTFSFQRDMQFANSRNTPRLKAQYYVASNFEKDYPLNSGPRRDLEHDIELQFIRTTQSECEYQEKKMWKRIMNARRNTDPKVRAKEVDRAKGMPRASCEKLEKIKEQYPMLYRAAQVGGGMGWEDNIGAAEGGGGGSSSSRSSASGSAGSRSTTSSPSKSNAGGGAGGRGPRGGGGHARATDEF